MKEDALMFVITLVALSAGYFLGFFVGKRQPGRNLDKKTLDEMDKSANAIDKEYKAKIEAIEQAIKDDKDLQPDELKNMIVTLLENRKNLVRKTAGYAAALIVVMVIFAISTFIRLSH